MNPGDSRNTNSDDITANSDVPVFGFLVWVAVSTSSNDMYRPLRFFVWRREACILAGLMPLATVTYRLRGDV
jgi:hypothetical protein